jgi:chemotaxis protein MotB
LANTVSKNYRRTDIWPGFVDALATLLMVIIFLLMIFVISQFFMGYALSGRDQALQKLEEQVTELGELLSLERKNNEKLLTELQASLSAQDTLRAKAATLSSENTNYKKRIASLVLEINNAEKLLKNKQVTISSNITQIKQLSSQGKQLQEQLSGLRNKITIKDLQLGKERKLSKSALDRLAMLNRQIRTLKSQLNFISMALEKSEILAKKRRVKIANLGKRLNAALASKVQELSRYRSEFFGELRKVLGSESGIQIVGDRFVFQSEVLFGRGSDQLGRPGKIQIQQLSKTLKGIMVKIPPQIDWVLRVDGHTDQIPIKTSRFPSNWELSTARAISVVKFLIDQDIPATNLAATGFGEFQPINPGKTEKDRRQNRRIELKLTQR